MTPIGLPPVMTLASFSSPAEFTQRGRRHGRGEPSLLPGREAFVRGGGSMDRFAWATGLLEIHENLVTQQRGVRLYDGEEKVRAAIVEAAPGGREAGCGEGGGPPVSLKGGDCGLRSPSTGESRGWAVGEPGSRLTGIHFNPGFQAPAKSCISFCASGRSGSSNVLLLLFNWLCLLYSLLEVAMILKSISPCPFALMSVVPLMHIFMQPPRKAVKCLIC